MVTPRQRVRQRAAAAAAANRPDLSTRDTDVTTPVTASPSAAGLSNWPAILPKHRGWWLVHRVEILPDGARWFVLIAECATEREAFEVAGRQLHQVRITKWNSRTQPYFSLRDPLDRRERRNP